MAVHGPMSVVAGQVETWPLPAWILLTQVKSPAVRGVLSPTQIQSLTNYSNHRLETTTVVRYLEGGFKKISNAIFH